MSSEALAIGLTIAAHFVGLGALVWLLLDGQGVRWSELWPRDEPPGEGPLAPSQRPTGGTDLPLPEAAPAALRLRGPGRLADARRRERRPAREPERSPDRAAR